MQREGIVAFGASAAGVALVAAALEEAGLSPVRRCTNLGELRSDLVRGSIASRVVLCVSLDDETIGQCGDELARLLTDRPGLCTALHCVGVYTKPDAVERAARLGCDICLDNTALVRRTVEYWLGASTTSGVPLTTAEGGGRPPSDLKA